MMKTLGEWGCNLMAGFILLVALAMFSAANWV